MNKGILCIIFYICIYSASGQDFRPPVTNPFGITKPVPAGSGQTFFYGSFADLDADGDMDLLFSLREVGRISTQVSYVQNIGTPSSPVFARPSFINAISGFRNDFDFFDFHNDGDLDLLHMSVSLRRMGLVFSLNAGSPSVTQFRDSFFSPGEIAIPGNPPSEISLNVVDFDGDGTKEFLVIVYFEQLEDGNVLLFRNHSSTDQLAYTQEGFNPWSLNIKDRKGKPSLAVTDYMDVGSNDVFIAYGNGDLHYFKNIRNSPEPVYENEVINPFGFTSAYDGKRLVNPDIDFVDIDADGDQDLFAFNANGDIVFYESTLYGLVEKPTDLKAVLTTNAQVALEWVDHASDESGFDLERSTDGTNFTLLTTLQANTTSFTDTDVQANTSYFYRVRARKNGSLSAYSNVASVSIPELLLPPVDLTLTFSADELTVLLNWEDASDNEDGFYIERASADDDAFVVVATLGPNETEYADAQLALNTTYRYRVVAFTNTGAKATSNEVSINTGEEQLIPLDIPDMFTPNGDGKNDSWNILNLDYYSSYHIRVFNRRGETVYESKRYLPENEWKGMSDGKELPDGSYVYHIELNDGKRVVHGTVSIFRTGL